jgi:hypothetical protein
MEHHRRSCNDERESTLAYWLKGMLETTAHNMVMALALLNKLADALYELKVCGVFFFSWIF